VGPQQKSRESGILRLNGLGEKFMLNDELYIVLALDRPFDYTTWKAEE
jgi:hypothetical protein